MSVADRIGLFPFFEWMTGHPFWVTLLICWAITPGGMILVGIIGESRLIPLVPSRQYLSFFPGDFFLGTGAAALITAARSLPEERRWYSAPALHLFIVAAALAIIYALTRMEWKSGQYATRAVFSPTKLYHQVVLCVFYGYFIAATLIAAVAGLNWSDNQRWFTLAAVSIGVWMVFMVLDQLPSARVKSQYAHIEHWRPVWSSGT